MPMDIANEENMQVLIQKQLLAMADENYRLFQARLIPNIDSKKIIGVRMPALRLLAGKLKKSRAADAFGRTLPHIYHEENVLHGLLIAAVPDYHTCIKRLEEFFPYIDNWAVCDTVSPAVFKRHRRDLWKTLYLWLEDEHVYTVRFAVRMLMNHYLDEDFQEEYLQKVADIKREEYYLKMMVAWYFATALARQYQKTLPILEQGQLLPWIHNKTIQKACESYCISAEQKTYLRTLRRKDNR